MRRRDFLKLSAAPIVIPWVPSLIVIKAKTPPPWTDFPDSSPITDIERAIETLHPEPIEYDTLTMRFDITDENGNYIDLWSKEVQSTFEAYAIFTAPSGREHVVKCDLNRNPHWLLTSATATINLIEKGTWKAQTKLLLPENKVHYSEVQYHEYY